MVVLGRSLEEVRQSPRQRWIPDEVEGGKGRGWGGGGPSLFETLIEQTGWRPKASHFLDHPPSPRSPNNTTPSTSPSKSPPNIYSTKRLFKLDELYEPESGCWGGREREEGKGGREGKDRISPSQSRTNPIHNTSPTITRRTFRAMEILGPMTTGPESFVRQMLAGSGGMKEEGGTEGDTKDHHPGPYGDKSYKEGGWDEMEGVCARALLEGKEVEPPEGRKYSRARLLGYANSPYANLPPQSIPFLCRSFPHILRLIPGKMAPDGHRKQKGALDKWNSLGAAEE